MSTMDDGLTYRHLPLAEKIVSALEIALEARLFSAADCLLDALRDLAEPEERT